VKTGALERRRKNRERERIHELVESMLRVDFWTQERKTRLEDELNAIMRHTRTSFDVAHEMLRSE
jgi:hypothetical protein